MSIIKCWMGKNVEGNASDLIWRTYAVSRRDWVKPRNPLGDDNKYSPLDLNRNLPNTCPNFSEQET
jgi:hypothetical protein